MLSIHMLNDVPVSSFGLCLFNSSSTSMCINERAVPSHVSPERGEAETVTTTQGTYSSQKYFNSSTSRYDFIVGRDILRFGFILDHAHNCIIWDGLSIPMTVHAPSTSHAAARTYFSCPHTFQATYAAAHTPIKEAKYESISSNEVAKQYTHLSSIDQSKLSILLSKFPTLFSGKLGRYNKIKFTLELKDPSISPIFYKPYPIAQTHMAVFKQELSHLIDK